MEVVSGGTLQDAISKMRNAFDGKPDGMLLLSSIDERLGVVGAARPEASSSRDWIEDATWPETTAKLGAEMAEGLAYAHSRGVLHRDLKPANVLLTAEAKPKLADFNVSFNGGRADENPEDTFGGSLAYMSPEQLEACHPLLGGSPRNVRAASDVYALGVMLWELLTGRRPFRDELAPADGGQLVKLQRMIETRRRTDFGKLTAELPWNCPQSLRDVLAKCLAPEAAERFASADELARSLRLCLNPRCYELLQAPTTRRGRFAVHWPILAVVLAGLIPNLLTAAFNFSYNKSRIASMDQGVIDRFNVVQMWINGLAFPIGVGLGAWGALRAFTALRRRDVAATAETSGHMLLFGRFISAMLLAVWSVSGLAFPIAVGWGENVPNPLGFHLHFISSLALSGCASTAYPYFLITWLATRYFVPALVRQGKISGPLRGDLKRVAWWNRFHLGVAALVPMLGMFVVVMFADFQRDDPNWWVLPVVSGGGLLGFGAMMWLDRQIAQDSAALEHIAVVESRGPGGRASGRGSRSGTARRTGA